MSSHSILEKVERLRTGQAPRVLDLFSGCGGLSLGFKAAGCDIVGAVEADRHAAATHGRNLRPGEGVHALPRDIDLNPVELAMALGLTPVEQEVDILVGGPPCQAFSRAGRAKLRDLRNHPEAFRHDPRARLYLRYIEYVKAFQPLAILIENVPDVIRFGGQNIPEEICEVLEDLGYRAAYTLLNAVHYGVPHFRERMFLIAYRRELHVSVSFPEPTHWIALPQGYRDTRTGMLGQLIKLDRLGPRSHAMAAPAAREHLPPAVNVREAIHDLPPIIGHADGSKNPPGFKSMGKQRFYDRRRRVSSFAHLMKNWPDFESGIGIPDHVTRCLPRDWRIFAGMQEGDRYPEALRLAETLFEREVRRLTAGGEDLNRNSDSWRNLRARYVPPYPADKFPDKWRKMEGDKPARTVMAHLSRDCYSHIHYDSRQARTLSIREAARLQSFPDGFVFSGGMNAAFRQIGNAVPPLLANSLALHIRAALPHQTHGTMEEFTVSEATA